MKSLLAIVLIAVIVAAFLHVDKIKNETDEVDKMAMGLKGIEKLVPVNANISVRLIDVPSESWLYCRYLLAPRHLTLNRSVSLTAEARLDTELLISNINSKDSLLQVITNNRKIIWANNDVRYKYYLTCNYQ